MSADRPANPATPYISLGAFIVLTLLAVLLFVKEPNLSWLGYICLLAALINLVGSIYTFITYRRQRLR